MSVEGARSRGSHRRQSAPRDWRKVLIAGAVVVVVAAGVTGGLVLSHKSDGPTADALPKPKIIPLNVLSTTPAASAASVASNAVLTVSFTTALSKKTPLPALTPTITGSWSLVSPDELQFQATAPMIPSTSETITIPGGPQGMLGTKGQRLAAAVTVPFSVAGGSVLRLQELLAQLNYLPLTFTQTAPNAPQDEAQAQTGTFAWRWANQPASLTSLWTEGTSNTITQGAVMAFEDGHGLATDGVAGPQVWTTLLQAAVANQVSTQAYGYVYVSEGDPESATVYQNGAAVYSTPVNTGVAAAPTATGTFPVYERFQVTTMTGTNPDGSQYSDPGIPWVSYFNGGDALHGFIRASYGFPQSDGCVEMPYQNAAVVWPMTPIGTLVTVGA